MSAAGVATLLVFCSAMSFSPGPNTTLSTALAANHGLRRALRFCVAVPTGWTLMMLACGLDIWVYRGNDWLVSKADGPNHPLSALSHKEPFVPRALIFGLRHLCRRWQERLHRLVSQDDLLCLAAPA